MTTETGPRTKAEEALEELYRKADDVEEEETGKPREFESALLTIALFVSLVAFAFGCVVGW